MRMTVTHYLTFYVVYGIQRFRFVSYLHKPMIVVALYGIGQTIIFSSCGLFLSIFSPRLISAAAHWMSTILPRMVWP